MYYYKELTSLQNQISVLSLEIKSLELLIHTFIFDDVNKKENQNKNIKMIDKK